MAIFLEIFSVAGTADCTAHRVQCAASAQVLIGPFRTGVCAAGRHLAPLGAICTCAVVVCSSSTRYAKRLSCHHGSQCQMHVPQLKFVWWHFFLSDWGNERQMVTLADQFLAVTLAEDTVAVLLWLRGILGKKRKSQGAVTNFIF